MTQEPQSATGWPLEAFDPRWRAFRKDPYPFYHRLRAESPVHRIASTGAYWVTRYDLARDLLQDRRLSSHPPDLEAPDEAFTMLAADPPVHTRLRSLVSQAFTPRTVERLRPRIEEIAQALLDRVRDRGRMEVVAEFAFPLPAMVIAELMGVPWEDRQRFAHWSHQVVMSTDAYQPREVLEAGQKAQQELVAYFSELVAHRKQRPQQGDLITDLIAAEEAGDRLSGPELLMMCFLLLIAGHETTSNLIAGGLYALLRHRDQYERLRRHPELVASAVEELLRFEPSVQRRPRFTVEETEIGGVRIPRGVQVLAVIGAANRDPAVFPDPDRLDIGRTENPHLSFGRGIHFCLGAHLARIEGAIAFRALMSLPPMELDAPEPEWADVTTMRRLMHLSVRFG